VGSSISGSRRNGVVPSNSPSLRVERSRRDRCSGSRVLLVGGGAGNSSTRRVEMVVVDMSSFVMGRSLREARNKNADDTTKKMRITIDQDTQCWIE
jgi:hypothetical protein